MNEAAGAPKRGTLAGLGSPLSEATEPEPGPPDLPPVLPPPLPTTTTTTTAPPAEPVVLGTTMKKKRGRKKKVMPLLLDVAPVRVIAEGAETPCQCVFSSLSSAHAADDTLKYVQPFQVYACREHSARVDDTLWAARDRGCLAPDPARGRTDACCAVCGTADGARGLVRCARADCGYAFCLSCVQALRNPRTHGTTPVQTLDEIARDPHWPCFVCQAARLAGKDPARAANLRAAVAAAAALEARERHPRSALADRTHNKQHHQQQHQQQLQKWQQQEQEQGQEEMEGEREREREREREERLRREQQQEQQEQQEQAAVDAGLAELLQMVANERLAVCLREPFAGRADVRAVMERVKENADVLAGARALGAADAGVREALRGTLAPTLHSATWLLDTLSLRGRGAAELAAAATPEQLAARRETIARLRAETEVLTAQVRDLVPVLQQHIAAREAAAQAMLAEERRRQQAQREAAQACETLRAQIDAMKARERALRDDECALRENLRTVARALAQERRREVRAHNAALHAAERRAAALVAHRAQERGERTALRAALDAEDTFRALAACLAHFERLHRAGVEHLLHRRADHALYICPSAAAATTAENNNVVVLPSSSTSSETSTTTTTTTLEVPMPGMQTAVFYDPDSLKHVVPDFHCECPARIEQVVELVEELALHPSRALRVHRAVAPADERYIRAVHEAAYLDYIREIMPLAPADPPAVVCAGVADAAAAHADELDPENFDTFVTWGSWAAARRAAGAVLGAIDAVSSRECRNAFCAVRPPGHHAGRHGQTDGAPSQGFCIINNVAIGAMYAVAAMNYERVAVVDFDVHHGNGTQDILGSDDPDAQRRFLFVSIHAYDERKYFFPGTGAAGEGPANVLNVPLRRHSGTAAYLHAFETTIVPRLDAFRPQLLLLSAGFDGHKDDPTRGLRLEAHDYYHITQLLLGVAQRHCSGRVVSVLEGGYDTSTKTLALVHCVRYHLMALMNQQAPDGSGSPMSLPPSPSIAASLDSPFTVPPPTAPGGAAPAAGVVDDAKTC